MARTLRKRWRDDPLEQTLEQLGHAALPCASLSFFGAFAAWGFPGWSYVGGLAATVPWVALREGVDSWPIESWGDATLDVAFFLAGGALGGRALEAIAGL